MTPFLANMNIEDNGYYAREVDDYDDDDDDGGDNIMLTLFPLFQRRIFIYQ